MYVLYVYVVNVHKEVHDIRHPDWTVDLQVASALQYLSTCSLSRETVCELTGQPFDPYKVLTFMSLGVRYTKVSLENAYH